MENNLKYALIILIAVSIASAVIMAVSLYSDAKKTHAPLPTYTLDQCETLKDLPTSYYYDNCIKTAQP